MDVSGSTGILIIKNPDIPSTDVNMLAFFQMEVQFGESLVPCHEWKPVSWITCKISLNAKRLFLEDLLWRLAKNRQKKNILHVTCLLPNSHQRSTKKKLTKHKKKHNESKKQNSRHGGPHHCLPGPPQLSRVRGRRRRSRGSRSLTGVGFFRKKKSTLDFNHGGRDTWDVLLEVIGSMVRINGL